MLAFRVSKLGNGLKTKFAALHLDLGGEHICYEVERLSWLEQLFLGNELVFLNQFQVQNVIDETKEQVDLRYDDEDEIASDIAQLLAQQVLEEH